jgi:hypothetical protein
MLALSLGLLYYLQQHNGNNQLYIIHPASFLQSIIYGFDIGKKKIDKLLDFFFVCKRFNTVQTSRIHLPKILIFFFICFFGGTPSRVLAGTIN